MDEEIMDLIVNNGKPVEPSKMKKVVAAVTRDPQAIIVFTHADIQQMIVNKLWLKRLGYRNIIEEV